MTRDIEHDLQIDGHPVNAGRNPMGQLLTLAQGWYKLNVQINIALTIGTGSGAITDGELHFVKNILLRTDAGELICDLPGKALYKIATAKAGSPPTKDAIAAATATYVVNIPIWFVDEATFRPEDTILNTAWYKKLIFDINIGDTSDLLTTPGTASVVTTVDVEVLRTADVLPVEAWPTSFINYEMDEPADPNSVTNIDILRDPTMNVKRLYVQTSSGATTGQGFTGANDDDVIETFSLEDHQAKIQKDRKWTMAKNDNKDHYALESEIGGMAVIDFIRDGSLRSALETGNLGKLKLVWENDATVAANDQVAIAREGIRQLQAAQFVAARQAGLLG